MRSLLPRIARASVAAVLGAAWSLALLSLTLIVMVVVLQAALFWLESGTFELLPSAAPAAGAEADAVVVGATPDEEKIIREAVAGLRYWPAPGAAVFTVTSEPCDHCAGEFVTGINLIRMQREMIRGDRLLLRRAIAHEIGHYVDQNLLTDAQRAAYMRERRIPATVPWSAEDKAWQDRPSEDFAEVFSILDVGVATGPVQTTYGPIRDAAAFERLLGSAGVHLDRPAAPRGVRFVVAQEIAFAQYLLTDWWMRATALVVFAFYALYGAVLAWRKTWRTAPGTHTPHAIPSQGHEIG